MHGRLDSIVRLSTFRACRTRSLHTNRRRPIRDRRPGFIGYWIRCQRPVPAAVGELKRSAMSTSFVTAAAVALALLVSACQSQSSTPEDPQTQSVVRSVKSPTVGHSVPSDLPTFGTPTTNSIRVAVFGMNQAVKRPGYYHLPRGAVVRDAVEAAQGLSKFTWWRLYSGIDRPKPDGTLEYIQFTRDRTGEEQIVLQDGDRIYFGQEVY